jgi:hypothetical protein
MKKIFLIYFLFLFVSVNAQVNMDDWANKYHYYRERLNNYFVSVGPNPGQSIPAALRQGSDFACNDGTTDFLISGGMLGYDDAPDYHGWYLGTLATEYYLTQRAGGDLSGIVKELYYALYAINRLDQTDGGIGNTALDGFYIREDVPADFVIQHPELQNYHLPIPGDNQLSPVINVDAFSDCPGGSTWAGRGPDAKAMSMDHDTRILMGLALIKKFVDGGASYGTPFQDGVTSLQSEAIAMADRIITYMKSRGWFLYMPTAAGPFGTAGSCGSPLNTFDPLQEPCTSCPVSGGTELVPRGCAPIEYCFGIAKAGQFITGINYQDATTLVDAPVWEAGMYDNIATSKLYSTAGNLAQVFILVAIGDSWQGLLPGHDTQYQMHHLDMDNYDWRFYTLLHDALHDESSLVTFSDSKFCERMNNAPCTGPTGNDANWHHNNTFDCNNDPNAEFYQQTAYNGLDYMLLYNLWYINYESSLPPYTTNWIEFPTTTSSTISNTDIALSSPVLDFTYNLPGGAISCPFCPFTDIGSSAHPVEVRALKSVTATNKINTSTNVTYKAGNIITLNPGFVADNGSLFTAFIEPTYCSGGEYRLASSDPNQIVDGIPMSPAKNIAENKTYSPPSKDIFYSDAQKKENGVNSIQIIPNPNAGQFHISGAEISSQIEIYNSIGLMVYKTKLIAGQFFDLSDQPKGIYLIKIIGTDGKINMGKIIKQ